jgi:hypothetical protein
MRCSKDIIEKNSKTEEQRELVNYAIAEHELSERIKPAAQ